MKNSTRWWAKIRDVLYRLGAAVQVYLREADGMTGSSVFALTTDAGADIPGVTFKKTNRNAPDPRKNRSGRFIPKGKKKPPAALSRLRFTPHFKGNFCGFFRLVP
jgi:hypothetical protein